MTDTLSGTMPFVRASRSSVIAAQLWPIARDAVSDLVGAVERRRAGGDELDEARELLAYWERRARRLPHWSVLQRREARAAARIWRQRVTDAERLRYGRGMVGAMTLYAAERRLPVAAAHRGHQLARMAGWTALAVGVFVLLLVVAATAVIV